MYVYITHKYTQTGGLPPHAGAYMNAYITHARGRGRALCARAHTHTYIYIYTHTNTHNQTQMHTHPNTHHFGKISKLYWRLRNSSFHQGMNCSVVRTPAHACLNGCFFASKSEKNFGDIGDFHALGGDMTWCSAQDREFSLVVGWFSFVGANDREFTLQIGWFSGWTVTGMDARTWCSAQDIEFSLWGQLVGLV